MMKKFLMVYSSEAVALDKKWALPYLGSIQFIEWRCMQNMKPEEMEAEASQLMEKGFH